MTEQADKFQVLKGGEFIISNTAEGQSFIPELFNEEQLLIGTMIDDFLATEVEPNRLKIEKQAPGLTEHILKVAAELGLLGAHMPAEYGGMELDTNTNTLISEKIGPAGSWSVAYAAHTGIGMLPILFFGNDTQKQKYLPKLIAGEFKASYCLTEPTSGSDALAAKTRADLSPDGNHYIINGQKMWITNAGFADIFIVFAQVDGDKFTGFILEKDYPGLTLGAEEDKLGIKGSSTRQLFFENVKVPKENVLGDIGKGHLIAFNALNIGRFKLGVLGTGAAKRVLKMATTYAKEREQFNTPIANFGAIKYKLAESAIRIFVSESSTYRISDLLQDKKAQLRAEGKDFAQATLEATEEYAIECSIIKVYGSEMLDYIVDENVQIHGGIGYSEEFAAARAYRDARINRIFEGTNEINRLLLVDQLFRRALKGRLDLVSPAWAVQKELASMPSLETVTGAYGHERKALAHFKKVLLMVAGAAAKKQMDGELDLKVEQQIVSNIADLMIEVFNAESILLRIERLATIDNKPQSQDVYDALLKTYFWDAQSRIQKSASDALASFADGDMLRTFMMGLKRFTKYPPVNVRDTRRLIASKVIDANGYCF